jgi:hypothetical protein
MLAYLVVVPTPYFGKTDARGTATIAAPAGRYRVELWHPRLAQPMSEEATLADAAPVTRSFRIALKPDRRIRRSDAARSGGYR